MHKGEIFAATKETFESRQGKLLGVQKVLEVLLNIFDPLKEQKNA